MKRLMVAGMISYITRKYILAFSCITLSLYGCVFSDKKNDSSIERGNFVVSSSDSIITTYPGGGGIILLNVCVDSAYSGSIEVTTDDAANFDTILYRRNLTKDALFTDVVIIPDSSITIGSHEISITLKHAGIVSVLPIQVVIVEGMYIPTIYTSLLPDGFESWVQNNHPEIEITKGGKWYRFSNNPIQSPGLPSDWTYINDEWHIRSIRYARKEETRQIMLRKRGELKGTLAVQKDSVTPFFEIPIQYFGTQ